MVSIKTEWLEGLQKLGYNAYQQAVKGLPYKLQLHWLINQSHYVNRPLRHLSIHIRRSLKSE